MAHLLRLTATTPPTLTPTPPPAQNINASKTALLVENDESLLRSIRYWLEREGYAVRTASNTEEGLRLYRDCAPFHVVVVNYFVPPNDQAQVDCLAPKQTESMDLVIAIRNIDPSQGIIIVALGYLDSREVPRPAEVMNIPLLVDISILQLRSLLEKIEVDRAIKMLTPCELSRLQQVAKFRIRFLGRAAGSRDWEDLLGEALLRTLIGAGDSQSGRHWNKKIPFVQHLTWAMSSIANVWKRQFKQSTYLVSELIKHTDELQERSPLDNLVSVHMPADEHLIEEDEEHRILAIFKDDPEATLVLRGWMDGLRNGEIMSKYGLVGNKYAATVKRIRLKLLGGKSNRRGGNKNGI